MEVPSSDEFQKLCWVIGNSLYSRIEDRKEFERQFHFYGKQAGLDPTVVHDFMKACSIQYGDRAPTPP